jgi:hypothetical protein
MWFFDDPKNYVHSDGTESDEKYELKISLITKMQACIQKVLKHELDGIN